MLFFGIFFAISLSSIFWHSAKAKRALPSTSLPWVALGKAFAECFSPFTECLRHLANKENPVVIYVLVNLGEDESAETAVNGYRTT